MTVFTARAPAKINLTLHVLGRRLDGYHELQSLVAFAGAADRLHFQPGPHLSLALSGPNAEAAGVGPDNLVLRAARHFADWVEGARLGAFRLEKSLPVAAGIGGGSADAAAALRLLADINGVGLGDSRLVEAARACGADVPVCLHPRARTMGGIGHDVCPPLVLPRLFAVLVNPRVGVETRAVFTALNLEPGQRLAAPSLADAADPLRLVQSGRNDLEAPAIAIAPVIADLLARLRALPGVQLARMSGSGATCFALFPSRHHATAAARALRRERPDWWIRPTLLR